MPINCRPKRMMTPPPIKRIQGLVRKEEPSHPAAAPRLMKIIESPTLKASELKITARRALAREPSLFLRRPRLTPEIREIWPGTSGSTQGEMNERKPAAKAIG